MPIPRTVATATTTVNELFYQPLEAILPELKHRWPCPELDDDRWLRLGVERVLEGTSSGRAFLQENQLRLPGLPQRSNYFESLKSSRRAALAREANQALLGTAETCLPDLLGELSELQGSEVFALDGHWRKAATHDARAHDGKPATGHIYSLNLRHHTLRHLAVNEYPKENDMHVLQRLKPTGLRQGVPRGKRTLLVYDRAGIDFKYWQRCRKECAVYFLSRVKAGMVYDWLYSALWDRSDPRNAGVLDDRRIHAADNIPLRIVHYLDPVSGQEFEFLTNEPDLPPGVIVELYRRRWEIEKVFDDLKNKLGQKKSWSSHANGKEAQGQLVALTHNLLRLAEHTLEQDHGIVNQAEDERRGRRRRETARKVRRSGGRVTSLLERALHATQRSVKLIRWLRDALRTGATVGQAAPILTASYSSL